MALLLLCIFIGGYLIVIPAIVWQRDKGLPEWARREPVKDRLLSTKGALILIGVALVLFGLVNGLIPFFLMTARR